jgi:hypothetical protein
MSSPYFEPASIDTVNEVSVSRPDLTSRFQSSFSRRCVPDNTEHNAEEILRLQEEISWRLVQIRIIERAVDQAMGAVSRAGADFQFHQLTPISNQGPTDFLSCSPSSHDLRNPWNHQAQFNNSDAVKHARSIWEDHNEQIYSGYQSSMPRQNGGLSNDCHKGNLSRLSTCSNTGVLSVYSEDRSLRGLWSNVNLPENSII